MLKDKTPSGESSLDMLLEEGQLPPPKTTSHSQPGGSNSSAAAFQYLSNILNVPVVSNKPTRDFNTLVKEGQDKKRYSDAVWMFSRVGTSLRRSPLKVTFLLLKTGFQKKPQQGIPRIIHVCASISHVIPRGCPDRIGPAPAHCIPQCRCVIVTANIGHA